MSDLLMRAAGAIRLYASLQERGFDWLPEPYLPEREHSLDEGGIRRLSSAAVLLREAGLDRLVIRAETHALIERDEVVDVVARTWVPRWAKAIVTYGGLGLPFLEHEREFARRCAADPNVASALLILEAQSEVDANAVATFIDSIVD